MWNSIHNRLFASRDSAQRSNDGHAVSGILLTAAAFDASPPASEAAALATLRAVLRGTLALEAVERAFSGIGVS